MANTHDTLHVLMNGKLTGTLHKRRGGSMSFHYAEPWLAEPAARPISLSLPLATQVHESEKVYNFFDNLLPDDPMTRRRLQARFSLSSSHPFDLLAQIGQDCIGALQITPANSDDIDIHAIQATPVSDSDIANTLKSYQTAPLGMTEETDDFRISLAGVQEKSAFLYHEGQWCRPHGTTPTSHIFKLPMGMIAHQQINLANSCENEWLCGKIAEAYGLPVAKASIATFADVKVLISERFDRKYADDGSWIIRLPQEDMCQAFGVSSNLKYQSDGGFGIQKIMGLLRNSSQASIDRANFFRAQILFWLLAAIDGHGKNFSIFIEPNGRYRLTPLYDILSVHPLLANRQLEAQKIKMAMAIIGSKNHYRWLNGQRRHILNTANSVGFSPPEALSLLDDMLEKTNNVIAKVADELPNDFPNAIAEPIFKGIQATADRLGG
ncbi:MAG: serine/threonine protein kinase [Legionellales bacterium]|nr:serine/threonine protein kinase [Legionellales bacterium]|tara:strand:- start:12372 stop:13682 length:1311 start_codon:yes stop_codon:yes gene_type:complete